FHRGHRDIGVRVRRIRIVLCPPQSSAVVCSRGKAQDSETGDESAVLLPRMARGKAAADNRMVRVQVLGSFRTRDAFFTFSKPALGATRAFISPSTPVSACNRVSVSS